MISADLYEPNSVNEQVVKSFFTTLMNKELDAFCELWAEDAVQEIPFAPVIEGFESTWIGKKKIVAYYLRAIPDRRDHVFWIHAMHQTADPDCLIVEASAHSVVATTGRVYDQRYVNIFRIRDGKIALLREYVNPLLFAKAFL